jgi:hypothetical protein
MSQIFCEFHILAPKGLHQRPAGQTFSCPESRLSRPEIFQIIPNDPVGPVFPVS